MERKAGARDLGTTLVQLYMHDDFHPNDAKQLSYTMYMLFSENIFEAVGDEVHGLLRVGHSPGLACPPFRSWRPGPGRPRCHPRVSARALTRG